MQKIILALILFFLLWASPSYAYIDPGTGSILLQGLFAGIAAVITTLSLCWSKIKYFFSKLKKNQNNKY